MAAKRDKTKSAGSEPALASKRLSDAELDALFADWWEKRRFDEEPVPAALSGNDQLAARINLTVIRQMLEKNLPLPAELQDYLTICLKRFETIRGITLGRAFGVERPKGGRPGSRAGQVVAIKSLIAHLHRAHDFPLNVAGERSAYVVASHILARKWELNLEADTLRRNFSPDDIPEVSS